MKETEKVKRAIRPRRDWGPLGPAGSSVQVYESVGDGGAEVLYSIPLAKAREGTRGLGSPLDYPTAPRDDPAVEVAVV